MVTDSAPDWSINARTKTRGRLVEKDLVPFSFANFRHSHLHIPRLNLVLLALVVASSDSI